MATRFHYALPIAREFALGARDRLLRGGLRSRLPPAADRPFVIVTGAGRSGTSAVARVLHESGVRMGTDFHPASDFNPVGFYEEMEIRLLNEQMLTELGMANFWRPTRWPSRSTVLAIARGYRDKMRSAVSRATEGWKDPLFAVTLEAWLSHLPSAPQIVLCLRSPDSFADSTARRYGLVERDASRQRWAQQYRRLLNVIRDYELDVTCVEYDELIERPEPVVAALSKFVGQQLSATYVDPPLRRFLHPVPQAYRALYDEVLALRPAGLPAYAASASLRAGAEGAPPDARSIDSYVALVRETEAGIVRAKASWTERIEMPAPAVERAPTTAAIEGARGASDGYAAVLEEAQEALRRSHPPAGFEGAHDLALEAVNHERLIVELMRAAVREEPPDQRMLRATRKAWRRFGSEQAFDRARQRRERELERALSASKRASEAQR
ncbi:MAG: sulfotransferase [Dehalococcoidia bacterium]